MRFATAAVGVLSLAASALGKEKAQDMERAARRLKTLSWKLRPKILTQLCRIVRKWYHPRGDDGQEDGAFLRHICYSTPAELVY